MPRKTYADRRTVLRATGGLVGLGGVAGTASAECYDVMVLAPYADVHDECDGTSIGQVRESTSGQTCQKCEDADGDIWWYCEWDWASPDGWVRENVIHVDN